MIPTRRKLFYILLGGGFPILFVWMGIFSHLGHLHEMREEIATLRQTAATRKQRQAVNLAARAHYGEADHFYIDKELETLTFLQPEIEALQTLLENEPSLPNKEITRRLKALKGENQLVFAEGVVQTFAGIQETVETQTNPVEVDTRDLRTILQKIDGETPNQPQLIVTDLKLKRKELNKGHEVYELDMKLLKREYL